MGFINFSSLERIGKNTFSYISSPIKNVSMQAPTGRYLQILERDTVQLSSEASKIAEDAAKVAKETAEYAKRLKSYATGTSTVRIGGEEFTRFEGTQMGSNPAFWAQNAKGELSYIKFAHDDSKLGHLESEALASELYRLAGIDAPKMTISRLENGSPCLKSEFIGGLEDVTDRTMVNDGFAVDAWLANWDGVLNGNTMIKNGKSVKLDCGGALRYRARGGIKPVFGEKVGELITLVNGMNPMTKYLYGTLTHADIVSSFKRVTSITDDAIKGIVKDENLAQTLIARRDYMSRMLEQIEAHPLEGDLAAYFTRMSQLI